MGISFSFLNQLTPCSIIFKRNKIILHQPWYVTTNNSMRCVWRICFSLANQMHNKALWTSFLFKHGSWCVYSHAYPYAHLKWHHKLLKKKHWQINFSSSFSQLPFLFLHFPFLLKFLFILFLFSRSAYVDPYWLVLVS